MKIARFPMIASDSSGMFLMGNDIMFYDGRPVRPGALTVWSFGDGDVGKPPGDFVFAYPRGLMRDGVLYMLWAEPDASSRTTDVYAWPGALTSIWGATYSRREGWSEPRRMFAGPLQSYEYMSPSAGATAATSAVDFGTTKQGDTTSIVTFTLTAQGWHLGLIPVGRGAGYPSVVRLGPAMVAAFVAGADDGPPDVNSVFVRRSRDDGRTWEQRLLLSRSGQRPAHETQVFADGNGQLHLIWRREMSDSQSALGHMMSPDGGRSWTRVQELLLSSSAYSVRAGVDACGQVHVFYADFATGQDHPRLGHVVWRGSWGQPVHEFQSLDVVGLGLHRSADGSLLLVFLARATGANDAAVPYRTLYTRLAH